MASFKKDPDEVLDFKIDWSAQMTQDGSDTISTATWSVTTGIIVDSTSKTTTSATVWLSGGTAGTEYDCVNEIVTAGGRTYNRTIKIVCEER